MEKGYILYYRMICMEFFGTISKQGNMRIIIIPKQLHERIKKIKGQISITIKEIN